MTKTHPINMEEGDREEKRRSVESSSHKTAACQYFILMKLIQSHFRADSTADLTADSTANLNVGWTAESAKEKFKYMFNLATLALPKTIDRLRFDICNCADKMGLTAVGGTLKDLGISKMVKNFQNPLGDDIFRNTTIALSGPKSTRQSQPIVLQSPLHLLTNNTSCQQQPLDARRQPGIQFSQDEMEGFETKRICQFIKREFSDRWPCYSNLIFNTNEMSCHSPKENLNLQVFVKEGNAVDLALEWGHELQQFIPTINTANEETVGGCWELNKTSPSEEEILCRRSNLADALQTPAPGSLISSHYPLPDWGGLYSPFTVVFRSSLDKAAWTSFEALPIISVSPVPINYENGWRAYMFPEERLVMQDKMRGVLRIAIQYNHTVICLTPFGCSNHFHHPAAEVALLWRKILFEEEEFKGWFKTVMFAIDESNGVSALKVFQDTFHGWGGWRLESV